MFQDNTPRIPANLVTLFLVIASEAAVDADSDAGLQAGHRFAENLRSKTLEQYKSTRAPEHLRVLDFLLQSFADLIDGKADIEVDKEIEGLLDEFGGDDA